MCVCSLKYLTQKRVEPWINMLLLQPKDYQISSCNAQIWLMIDYSNAVQFSSGFFLFPLLQYYFFFFFYLWHAAKYRARQNHQAGVDSLLNWATRDNGLWHIVGGYPVKKLRSSPLWFLQQNKQVASFAYTLSLGAGLIISWWALTPKFTSMTKGGVYLSLGYWKCYPQMEMVEKW